MRNRRLMGALIAASMLVVLTVKNAGAENDCNPNQGEDHATCEQSYDLITGGDGGGGDLDASIEFLSGGAVAQVVSPEAPLSIRVKLTNTSDSTLTLASGAITIQTGGIAGTIDPATSGPIEIPPNSNQQVVFSGLAAGAGPLGWAEARVTGTIPDDTVEPDADSLPEEVELADLDLESIFIAGSGAGAVGSVGPQGPAGEAGPAGPAGPSGSQLIVGVPQTTPDNPRIGTTISASAQCPSGKSALGGGARATSSAGDEKVGLVASYPDSSSSWSAKGTVNRALGRRAALTVEAYVLCSL